ncbi:MAG: antitoxin MazE family protein [Synergistaceae bacterium]|nr:antitoxin MazE family protein [Synergistaceae bacterium]
MATARERVARHRKKMAGAGMRPIQIWVPDTRKSTFADECHRQSMMLEDDDQEREILAFMESVTDTEGWE